MFFLLVPFFLERQCFVVDIASTASETAHLPLLFAVGHQLELEGLPTFHAFIIIWSMDKIKDPRHTALLQCTSIWSLSPNAATAALIAKLSKHSELSSPRSAPTSRPSWSSWTASATTCICW